MTTDFIPIPDTQLPCGLAVPAFRISRYLATAGELNPAGAACRRVGDRQPRQAAIAAGAYPWTTINHHDSRKAAQAAGYDILRESQYLAVAWLIYQQAENWTGGAVGEGHLYQGMHKDSVSCAMPATFEPSDPDERRWHVLPGGERIYDFAGNAFTRVFDDIQGDEHGLVAGKIAADSPSLQAPFPSLEKGVGWRPSDSVDWSGGALIRGGGGRSGRYAGVFCLDSDWPSREWGYVGFRCTQPSL